MDEVSEGEEEHVFEACYHTSGIASCICIVSDFIADCFVGDV